MILLLRTYFKYTAFITLTFIFNYEALATDYPHNNYQVQNDVTVNQGDTYELTGNSSTNNYNFTNNGGLTFSDNTNAGTSLITNNSGALFSLYSTPSINNATINSAGILDVSNITDGINIGALNTTGTFNLGGKALTLGGLNSNDDLMSGTILNPGVLYKSGTGTLTMGTNYPSQLFVQTGTVNINDTSYSGRIINNKLLNFNNSGYQNDLSSAQNLTNNSPSAVTNFNSGSYFSGTFFNSDHNGTINFNNNSYVNQGIIYNNSSGAVLNFNDQSLIKDNSTIKNAYIVNFNNNANAGASIITNDGTINFADNSLAGTSVITNNSDGSLYFKNSADSSTATIISSGTLDISGVTTGNTKNLFTTGSLVSTGTFVMGHKDLKIGGINSLDDKISGTVSDPGILTKIGSGTLNLNTTYANNIQVNTGILNIGNNGAFQYSLTSGAQGPTSATINLTDNATAINNPIVVNYASMNMNHLTTSGLDIGSFYNGGTFNLGSKTLNVSNGASLQGTIISQGGTIALNGGNSNLAAQNSVNFNGPLNINIASGANLSSIYSTNASNVSLSNNGTLKAFGPNLTLGSLISNGSINFKSQPGSSSITVGRLNSMNDSISGIVNNSGTLFKVGTGTLALNTNYLGSILANQGILNINSGGTITGLDVSSAGLGATVNFNGTASANNAQIKSYNNGTINFKDNSTADGANIVNGINNAQNSVFDITGITGATLNAGTFGNYGTLNLDNKTLNLASASTLNGIINSTGGTINLNSSTNFLTDNTSASNVTINGPLNINVASNANLASFKNVDGSNLTLTNAGKYFLYSDAIIGSLTSTGVLNFQNGTLTVGHLNSANDVISGIAENGGIITKVGTGSLALNTDYLGTLKANAGTLNINNAKSRDLTIASGATVNYNDGSSMISDGSANSTTVTNNGMMNVNGNVKFGNNNIINNDGASLNFSGGNTATTATDNAIITNAGTMDITKITNPNGLIIGSLNSTGTINIGNQILGIGNNNIDDSISGIVNVGPNGSIAKLGSGITNFNTNFDGYVLVNSVSVPDTNGNQYSGTLNLNGAGGGIGASYGSYNGPIDIYNGKLNINNSTVTNKIASYDGTQTDLNNSSIQYNSNNQNDFGLTNVSQYYNQSSEFNATFNINDGSSVKSSISNNTIMNFNGNSFADGSYIYNRANGNLTFNDTSFIKNGGSISNDAYITFNDNSSAGSSNIINNNTATLTFNGNSSAANSTIANSGTIDINSATNTISIGSLNNTGTLNLGNNTLTIGNLNSANDSIIGNINFNIYGGTSTSNGGVVTVNPTIYGSMIQKVGSGTLALGANYLGALMVDAGTLNISNAQTANLTVASGAITEYHGTSTINNSGAITNNGSINFRDSSTASSSVITTNANGVTKFYNSASGGSARMITNSGGLVDISGIAGDSITIGSIEGAGNYHLGNKNMIVGGNNLSTIVSGIISNDNGTLTKTGSGTMVLSGNNTYVGGTNIQEGVLQVDGSIMSPVIIESAGTLSGVGTIGGNVSNSGAIAPGDSGNNNAGVLTINGNYVGNNGKLNIRLMNNDNDVLVINNTTPVSGTTYVTLNGSGGKVSQNGIKIIETAGSEENAFVLSNPTMGAYRYGLLYGSIEDPEDNDWYLSSWSKGTRDVKDALRDDVDVYNTIAPSINQYGYDSMNEIANNRSINIDSKHKNKFWSNLLGSVGKIQGKNPLAHVGYKSHMVGVQVGRDVVDYFDQNGNEYIAGIYGALGKTYTKTNEELGVSKSDADVYSLGAYATYSNLSKLYADFIVQATKYDVDSTTFMNDKINPTAYNLGMSAGLGYAIDMVDNFVLKPQAQILYQYTNIKKVSNDVSTIRFNDTDSLRAKIGIVLSRDIEIYAPTTKSSKKGIITPEVSINYWHEYNKKNKIVISSLNADNGIDFSNKNLNNWMQYGLGIKGYAADNIQVYVSANYQATPNFKSYIVGGIAGIRINF